VLTLEALGEERARWSAAGDRVVLTNGVFDLLHLGHVRYLAAARALGDVLVVALNADASVTRLKGPGRPVRTWAVRAEMLAALRWVDAVVPFAEDTAEGVVRALAPEVYAKGGDYDDARRRPPEAAVAEALGARVVYLPLVAGESTTDLLNQLARRGA
jgi:glycerol-3-phosphate cytidylyltransferase